MEDAAPEQMTMDPAGARRPARVVIYRHSRIVRVTHWINLLAISLLLMSGLQIFNAHPSLYWGQSGADFDPPLLALRAVGVSTGHPVGVTWIAGHAWRTTGLFGVSAGADGQRAIQGISALGHPAELARPGRRAAMAFLPGLGVRAQRADLSARRPAQRPLPPRPGADAGPAAARPHPARHLGPHPAEAACRRGGQVYNVLQKLAYLAVVFLLLPAMVATGLTMSPGIDAAAPWLLTLFGGRQSARTVHFISANLIVLFVLVHVVEVVIAGAFNEIGSMITGWYGVRAEPSE